MSKTMWYIVAFGTLDEDTVSVIELTDEQREDFVGYLKSMQYVRLGRRVPHIMVSCLGYGSKEDALVAIRSGAYRSRAMEGA